VRDADEGNVMSTKTQTVKTVKQGALAQVRGWIAGVGVALAALLAVAPQASAQLPRTSVHWINIGTLAPASSGVTVEPDTSVFGVFFRSSVAGDSQWVETGVPVPPGFLVDGVRLCYELQRGSRSFVSQIRLAQINNPPVNATVMLDDGTDLTQPGPVCVNSELARTPIVPDAGALLFSLRGNFGAAGDRIRLISAALLLERE
jgi:hypothetical protein